MTRVYINDRQLAGAVSASWDDIKGKPDLQEELVSGSNIKTINNQSVLGEGNLDIEGGEGEYATMAEVVEAINEVIGERN